MATAAVAVTDTGVKAGFWIRTIAFIIDSIILAIIGSLIRSLSGADPADATGGGGIQTLIGVVYYTVLWSNIGGGQTVGMRIFNLKVVKTDGTPVPLLTAFIRYIGLIISFVVLFIGVIWVAFDGNKQGWHDKIAGTYVIKSK
jgi:uncharacterized RDD family membrane protein YckC